MKKLKIILLLFYIFLVAKFWIGMYEDDEFGEKRLFIKHKPIWKSYFYSPRGMRDWKIKDMPTEYQEEQKLFDEFIIKKIIQ